ncbi:response regulator transcription factor [Paenibacillus sp. NPDC058174]|uniref:response regulator transcription factor n=1 Tax=Paenibacillus sp. NPDC058174 TaxID=3346366 RepID=UPI0036DE1853
MRMNVLIADDDPAIRTLLRFILTKEGYGIIEAADGEAAARLLEQEQVQLAVVDIMMPAKNGHELCREIREHYDIPVIMLTARGEIEDKEQGFLSGTDDYMVKPFDPKELLFRMKALLRRYRLVSQDTIKLGSVIINRSSHEIRKGDHFFELPLREFELLSQLASNPGRIYTREQLIQLLWGTDYSGDSRTIDVHVKRLRERFAECQDDFSITTVRGLGYKLEAAE